MLHIYIYIYIYVYNMLNTLVFNNMLFCFNNLSIYLYILEKALRLHFFINLKT